MAEPLIPFSDKDIILIKVIRVQQEYLGHGFTFAPNVKLDEAAMDVYDGWAQIIFVNWEKVVFKCIGPVAVGHLDTIIRSEINAYGKKLVSATGDPKKEVCVRILL